MDGKPTHLPLPPLVLPEKRHKGQTATNNSLERTKGVDPGRQNYVPKLATGLPKRATGQGLYRMVLRQNLRTGKK